MRTLSTTKNTTICPVSIKTQWKIIMMSRRFHMLCLNGQLAFQPNPLGVVKEYTKYPPRHTLRLIVASLTCSDSLYEKRRVVACLPTLCPPLCWAPLESDLSIFVFKWWWLNFKNNWARFFVEKSPPKTRLRRYKPTFTYHCRQMLLYSWCTARSSFWSTNQLRKNTPK